MKYLLLFLVGVSSGAIFMSMQGTPHKDSRSYLDKYIECRLALSAADGLILRNMKIAPPPHS